MRLDHFYKPIFLFFIYRENYFKLRKSIAGQCFCPFSRARQVFRSSRLLQDSTINYELLRYLTDSDKPCLTGIIRCNKVVVETATFYKILQYSTSRWDFKINLKTIVAKFLVISRENYKILRESMNFYII